MESTVKFLSSLISKTQAFIEAKKQARQAELRRQKQAYREVKPPPMGYPLADRKAFHDALAKSAKAKATPDAQDAQNNEPAHTRDALNNARMKAAQTAANAETGTDPGTDAAAGVQSATQAKAPTGAAPAEKAYSNQSGPILEQAESYVLYGQMHEAGKLLKKAILNDPHNCELRLKLVEVYVSTHNESGLTQQELDLQAIGNTAALQRLAELKTPTANTSANTPPIGAAITSTTTTPTTTPEPIPEPAKANAPDDTPIAATEIDSAGTDTDAVDEALELAQECLDIAHYEAARDLLIDVLNDGSNEQRQQANALLAVVEERQGFKLAK